jgi:transposase
MKEFTKTVVGLDVHKETVVTGVLPVWSEKATGSAMIENHPAAIAKMVQSVTASGPVEFVYEAGPCGYEVQRQIEKLGHRCVVVAPGLIPVRSGDRVKTDRRDAEKLARLWRAGELTAIRIPSREEEASRDLVRAREDILTDRLRARHRLVKFLLRQGRVNREVRAWSLAHRAWLKEQSFEWLSLQQTFEAYVRAVEEAEARLATLEQQVMDMAGKEPYRVPVQYLRCFKGIETLSAITLVVEAQEFKRFESAPSFMKFTGLTGWEHSSADRICRGGISKAGNAHIRRVLVESAWSYRHNNVVSRPLTVRREGCPGDVVQLARRAQDRLHRRFHRMVGRNKPVPVTVVAVAREMAGFIWAMAQKFPSVN